MVWRYTIAAAVLAAIAWALLWPTPAPAQVPKCVTYNMGINRLSQMSDQTGWIVKAVILTPEQTDRFYEALINRDLASAHLPQAHQLAFVSVNIEPEMIGGLLYDEAGCVLPPKPLMPRAMWTEIMLEAFDTLPTLERVVFSRGA